MSSAYSRASSVSTQAEKGRTDHHKIIAAVMDAQGSALLASLIGFIQPIIVAAYSSSSSHQASIDLAHAYDPTQGQKLLKTLREIVGLVVEARDNGTHLQEKDAEIEEGLQQAGFVNVASANTTVDGLASESTALQSSIHRPISTQELPSGIKEKVQEHVFNKMPIRILAFDSNASQPQLLERNAIAILVLSRIQNAYPDGIVTGDVDDAVQKASQYAILSHTWIRGTPGDVVYQDWEMRELPAYSPGYSKITNFCEVAAREHGVSFGWMDTVCINKESSSELDESIRSMYKWYQLAHVCVTYLAETLMLDGMHHDSWFSRGWTLQELLAPRDIRFYNRNWQPLVPQNSTHTTAIDDRGFDKDFEEFTKYMLFKDYTPNMPVELQYQIFKATSITRVELYKFKAGSYVSLSRIMQLAACRKVTREEDSIYSLMGLLGVGIPIAYGEGSCSALRRIIREIMISTEVFMDIFHHNNKDSIIPSQITDYIGRSSNFEKLYSNILNFFRQPEPVVLTHIGVRLTVVAVPAFRKDVYERHIPSGCGLHTFNISKEFLTRNEQGVKSHQESQDYILLDESDDSANWTTSLVPLNDVDNYRQWDWLPTVIFMAILGPPVILTNGAYWFASDNAVCIPMRPGEHYGGKTLADIQPEGQISGPMTITLPYASSPERNFRIPQEKAHRLCFKSVTEYFN